MKTLIVKSGLWLSLTTVFISLIILLNLNLVSKVDKMLNRQEFEEFLNERISEFFINNSTTPFDEKEKEVKADSPDQAAMQDYLMTIDPELKTVPKERLKESYKYTCKLREENQFKATKSLQWQSTIANFGGRTRAIMWDPNDPANNKIWAGGVTGGLWYKNDISTIEAWIPVNDFWPALAVSCITFDPNDTQTYYVGTGEAQTALIIYRESSGTGFGIMRSDDAGDNWEVMPGTEEFEYVTDIEVRDENGTSIIYAAVASGLYKGTPHQSQPSDGLFRSVVGSDYWEQVLPMIDGLDIPFTPSDIEIAADGRIFIGTMQNIEGEGGATILYSDEGTEGTWDINDEYKILIENTPGFNLPGRVILAAAPSDANRIYALVAQGYYYGLPAYECHIVARSDDQGESWTMLQKPPDNGVTGNWAFIAWHALTAAVDPNDADRVFVGALDMFVSDEAGENWSAISNWQGGGTPNFIHADHHRILFQEGSSNKMLVATDGGIFYTVNASLGSPVFQDKNPGYNTLQMYKVALSPTPEFNLFLGGMQDNGTIYYDGNPITYNNGISGGDGGACFIDKDEPNTMITSSQNNRFYFFSNGQFAGQATSWGSGNFISSVDYDYNMNTLYANAVTVINNNQDSILRISGIPEWPYTGEFINMGTGSTVPFTHVKYSEFSPANSASLYLGTQSGRLFKADNAETTPDVVEIGSDDFPSAAISCVALGRSEDTILVTFSNYGVTSVWQSYDAGTEWQEKEGNLPDMPIRWAIYHPESSKAAMLATELGIWTSYTMDQEIPVWQPDNEGLANVRIDMLQLRESDLTVLAGTHGRGFYYSTFAYDPTTSVQENISYNTQVYPNPVKDFVEISIPEIKNENISYEVVSLDGRILLTDAVRLISGKMKVNLSDLNSGTYVIRIQTSKYKVIRKLLKI